MLDQIKNVPQDAVREALDRSIAAVAKRRYDVLTRGHDSPTIRSKVVAAQASMKSLGQGEQPDYNEWDALFYVTWYQPRHVNLIWSVLRQRLPDLPSALHVVDVGSGAWAVQIALAIVIAEIHPEPDSVDTVMHNIDSSRWMRETGTDLWFELWSRAKEHPSLEKLERVMRAMNSSCHSYDSYQCYRESLPARVAHATGSPHWCTFVHAVYDETIEHLVRERKEISKELAPQVLLVTGHEAKKNLVKRLAGGSAERVKPRLPWAGCLQRTTKLRQEVRRELIWPDELTDEDDLARRYLKATVEWSGSKNPIEKDWVLVRGWSA